MALSFTLLLNIVAKLAASTQCKLGVMPWLSPCVAGRILIYGVTAFIFGLASVVILQPGQCIAYQAPVSAKYGPGNLSIIMRVCCLEYACAENQFTFINTFCSGMCTPRATSLNNNSGKLYGM